MNKKDNVVDNDGMKYTKLRLTSAIMTSPINSIVFGSVCESIQMHRGYAAMHTCGPDTCSASALVTVSRLLYMLGSWVLVLCVV